MTFDRLNYANILVDYAFSPSNKSMATQHFKISNRNLDITELYVQPWLTKNSKRDFFHSGWSDWMSV